MKYIYSNGKVQFARNRVTYQNSAGVSGQADFLNLKEAVAYADELKSIVPSYTSGNTPDPDEKLIIVDDLANNTEVIAAATFNASVPGETILCHNKWSKVTIDVDNAAYGERNILFKYCGDSVLYIRGIKVADKADPTKFVRWGSFSDDTEANVDTCYLYAGSPDVIIGFEKEGISTLKIPQCYSNGQFGINKKFDVIPEGTSNLIITVEFWVDGFNYMEYIPVEEREHQFTNVEVSDIDISDVEWLENITFENENEFRKAMRQGRDIYSPNATEKAVEEVSTMLELAIVDIYESIGG